MRHEQMWTPVRYSGMCCTFACRHISKQNEKKEREKTKPNQTKLKKERTYRLNQE